MGKHAYTPGPWRWEMNLKSKVLHLVGGDTRYDLTIMDFSRWGLGGAVASLRDPTVDGMNLMHRLCDRKDWIAPFQGREHHADWCSDVTHPDMRLIAAAPDLYAALEALLSDWDSVCSSHGWDKDHVKAAGEARAALKRAGVE